MNSARSLDQSTYHFPISLQQGNDLVLYLYDLRLRHLLLDLGFQISERQVVWRGSFDVERDGRRRRVEPVRVDLDKQLHLLFSFSKYPDIFQYILLFSFY